MQVNFSVGTVIYIERPIAGKKVKSTSRIIGQMEPNFLLAEMPEGGGLSAFAASSARCIVRFLQDGTMLGFWAQVRRILTEPFPMMILQYPSNIEEVVLRRHERIDCNLPSSVRAVRDQSAKEVAAQLAALEEEQEEGEDAGEQDDSELAIDELAGQLQEKTGAIEEKEDEDAKGEEDENEEEEEEEASEESEEEGKPELPLLLSSVIDLGLQGCQIAVPVIDPRHPGMAGPDALYKIPLDDRGYYKLAYLGDLFPQKGVVMANFMMPDLAQATEYSAATEIRWRRNIQNHFLLGLQFVDPTERFKLRVQQMLDYQQCFFRRNPSVGGM